MRQVVHRDATDVLAAAAEAQAEVLATDESAAPLHFDSNNEVVAYIVGVSLMTSMYDWPRVQPNLARLIAPFYDNWHRGGDETFLGLCQAIVQDNEVAAKALARQYLTENRYL